MAFTNSSLVDYIKISPHRTINREYNKITKITIHHMAGNLTVEGCGEVFSGTREVSSNYGIGSDGRVGMYVEEKDRSWCSSNRTNDGMAITIEVANCGGAPDWPVSDDAYNKLIELCIDICRRNGIAFLNYTGDSSGNLTRHDMFSNTECPGPYLRDRFPEIAATVNQALGTGEGYIPSVPTSTPKLSTPKITTISTKTVSVSGDTTMQSNIEVGLYRADRDVLITSQVLNNQQGSFSTTFDGLSQGTLYMIKFTTNFSGNLITSDECIFRTLYDRPKSVTGLSLVRNTDGFTVKFKPPASWGTWDTTKYKRGYRVYLVKNGVVSVFSDEIIQYDSTKEKVTALIKLKDFNVNINYGDSIQIGVQAFIKENSTPIIFDQVDPICTNAICMASSKYLPVHAYRITSKGYQRLSVYSEKIKR